MKKIILIFILSVTTIINTYSQTCNFSLSQGSNSQTICLGSKVNYTTYDSGINTDIKGLPPGVTYKYYTIFCCCAPCPSNYVAINTDTAMASGIYTYTLVANCTNSVSPTTGTIVVSTTGTCAQNCFANFSSVYDTIQNQFTLYLDSAVQAASFHWDFGDGTTSTLAQPSHTYSLDTTYNVCLSVTTAANANCAYCHKIGKNWKGNIFRTPGFSLNVVNPNASALTNILKESSNDNSFVVSPNPTNGQTEIHFNKSVNNSTINIYNTSGQKVIEKSNFSGQGYSINLNHQPSGIYLIEVISENHFISRGKIIIQ